MRIGILLLINFVAFLISNAWAESVFLCTNLETGEKVYTDNANDPRCFNGEFNTEDQNKNHENKVAETPKNQPNWSNPNGKRLWIPLDSAETQFVDKNSITNKSGTIYFDIKSLKGNDRNIFKGAVNCNSKESSMQIPIEGKPWVEPRPIVKNSPIESIYEIYCP